MITCSRHGRVAAVRGRAVAARRKEDEIPACVGAVHSEFRLVRNENAHVAFVFEPILRPDKNWPLLRLHISCRL